MKVKCSGSYRSSLNPKDNQDAENGHHFSTEYLQINAQEIQPYQGSDTGAELNMIIERTKKLHPDVYSCSITLHGPVTC